jgi:quercetin dioxygenase-like cupin family protein
MRQLLAARVLLMSFGIAGLALATPPSERGVAVVNYTLVIDPDETDRVQIKLPTSTEYEEDATTSHGTRSPSVFVFQVYTANPNSNTGWHYHPGIVLATVAEGSVDWYDSHCVKHIHKAGDYFTENDHEVHEVRNTSSAPARLIITFIIAKGQTYKISAPAPQCARALGLS